MAVKEEWVKRFRVDAENHLNEIRQGIQNLPSQLGQLIVQEEIEAEQQALRELFRRAHSIKGAARMVGLDEIAELALKLEELFGQAYLEPVSFNQTQRDKAEQQIIELLIRIKSEN